MGKFRLIIFFFLFLLVGCNDVRLIEDIGFINVTGYDLYNEKGSSSKTEQMYQMTISVPLVDPDKTEPREVLSTVAKMSKAARMHLSRQTDRMLVSGQLRTAIYGMELAKQGIWEIIDTMVRDPTIGNRVKLAVINGSAKQFIEKDYPEHPRTGQYLDAILAKEARSNIVPDIDIHKFVRDYLDDGMDPVLPVLKQTEKHMVIDGIGLFRGDRFITKIDPKDALSFFMVYHNFYTGDLMMELTTGEHKELVTFSSFRSTKKTKVTTSPENKKFKLVYTINIIGNILEHHGELDLSDEQDQAKLNSLIEKHIETETKKLITFMQEHKVDSLGIGKEIRNSLSYVQWTDLNWEDVYPDVEVEVHANVKIRDFGMYK